MIKALSAAGLESDGTPFKKPSIQIEEAAKTISVGNLTWIECVVDSITADTPSILQNLGITMDAGVLLSGYVSSYEDRGETLGLMLPFVVTGNNKTQTSPILIFIKKDLIVTIHDDYGGKIARLYNYSSTLLRKLSKDPQHWADRQTVLLARIIDEISETNFSILRLIVERTEQLELDLAGSRQIERDLSLELSNMKTSLLTFLNAVWATYDTVQNLKYGDAEMVSDDDSILAKFEVILGRLDRQIQMSENLMQMIATGINVIQTQVSNKLGFLLVWFTVAGTAVLVPNTLATVFSIFPDHQDNFAWMLPTIIISTILSAFVTYKYTKRWRVRSFGMKKFKKFKKRFQ
ncbi:MAG: CorA family divalent cation transporter [Nitrosopumilaceae archaeon]